MKEYKSLTIIVRSGSKYRAFTTQSFSIRAFVVMLQRYNPDYQIVDYYEGPCMHSAISNDKWVTIPTYLPIADMMALTQFNCVDGYIQECTSYREAINRWYLKCSEMGIYPQKRPDRGCHKKTVTNAIYDSVCKASITAGCLSFIPDAQSPFDNPEDVLLYFNGKRYTAIHNADEIEGYVIKLQDECQDE